MTTTITTTSGATVDGVRIVDMPDLGAVTSGSSVVGERSGSGRFGMPAMSSYLLNITATGSTTPRPAADRAADWINVKDFGALLNGTTDDTAAFQAARNTTVAGGSRIFVPIGRLGPLSNITVPTGSSVIWELDAHGGAGAPIDFNSTHDVFDSDIVHALNQGEWWYQRYTSPTIGEGVGSILRIDRRITHSGGLGWPAIQLNDYWYEGSHPGNQMTGMVISTNIDSTTATSGPSVGLFVTTARRNGTLGVYAANISAADYTGVAGIGSMIGMELGLAGNATWATDHAGNLDLVLNATTAVESGGLPMRAGFAVRATNFAGDFLVGGYDHAFYFHKTNAYIAAFGGSGHIAAGAAGFDASEMTFADALGVAFRVGGENVLSFGNLVHPCLQYTSVGAPRLRYLVDGVEKFAINDGGGLVLGTLPPSAANDAAAAAAGVGVGGFYRTGSAIMIRTV